MNAGRELDALVAEKVMGEFPCNQWKHENLGSAGGPVRVLGGFHRGTQDELQRCVKEGKMLDDIIGPPCSHAPDGSGCYPEDSPPPYSTSIAAAWAVVEKLSVTTKQYWTLHYFSTGAQAYCDYDDHEYTSDVVETMPLAICLAALKAVQAEVPA